MATPTAGHKWSFFRSGGLDQVVIKTGADIANLETLDQKLWVALACPTRGIELDAATLDLIDGDKDGRIRVPEVLAAVRWLKDVLKSTDTLLAGGDAVPLAAIQDQTSAGKAILAGARHILASLGKADAEQISLADITATEKIFDAKNFNGDGIVPADSAPDEAAKAAIEDVIATHGSKVDRSGKPGVDRELIDAFFADAAALAAWQAAGDAPAIRDLAAAAAAVAAVKAKVDDYFSRCGLAALDPRAAGLLGATEADLTALSTKALSRSSDDVARLPIARVEAGRPLPLAAGVNPAWAAALAALARDAVEPLLGDRKETLSEAEWTALEAKTEPYRAWLAAKPASPITKLESARIRALLESNVKQVLVELVEKDLAVKSEIEQIEAVEKLVRLQRDFVRLLANFVNFSAFYSKAGAVFQVGTLYLDGRACDLCVRVADAGRHAALAGLSKSYLAYCDCVRRGTGQTMTIAAAFTDGDSDQLMVGRNGVFYDRNGNDWDATITKIIENPISIRQAFFGPYKRFLRMVEEQVAKRAAAADAAAGTKLQAAATATATADQTKATPAAAEPKKFDLALITGIGVAIGSIGTFVASIVTKFFDLGMWVPVGLLGIVLAISGPSMLIAWLKLRQRNLGPILDANGWAINGRVMINVPFGSALTSVATLPQGASRALTDPYAERKRPWGTYVFVAVLLALGLGWYVGKLDRFLPGPAKSAGVMGDLEPSPAEKPAAEAPAPAK